MYLLVNYTSTEGRNFNTGFLCSSSLNLTVKKYENWFTFAKFIVEIKVTPVSEPRRM